MKVTVENAVNTIFVPGTLVVHFNDDRQIVLVTESGDEDHFKGILIHSTCDLVDFSNDEWIKSVFKKFSGKITLEQ